jgi:N-sulfoglucosamine sulfohydrolase
MKPMTGRSLRPIFETEKSGRVVAERDHVLIGRERTDVGRPNDEGYPIRGIITAGHLYLRNYEPSRWPAGNPETGYLDTDGGPTKTLILERGRQDRSDVFWQFGFGRRPAEEFFDLNLDVDCVVNLATQPARAREMALLRDRMETLLRAQEDPRQLGRGAEFDRYPATQGAGFYETHRRGEPVKAGWVTPSDFEPAPLD